MDNIMELLLQWIIPGVVAIIAGIGAFKTVKKKTSKFKTLDELSDYLLRDETVVDIINNLISSCQENAVNYDTVEEFIEYVKQDIHSKFIDFIVSNYDLPEGIISELTIDNISYIFNSIFEKYNIKETLENIFNKVIAEEVENQDITDTIETDDMSETIDTFYE